MNTDLVIVLSLAGACVLVGLTSSLLYIVAGFRAGIGWGIVNLLPLGSLAFTICRWNLAKRPFLLSLVSAVLAFGAFAVARAKLNQGMPITAMTIAQFVEHVRSLKSVEPLESPESRVDSKEVLASLRDREVLLEEQIRATTAELKDEYAALLAKRKALPAADEKAVREFNQEAAAYSERKRQFAESKAKLTRLRQSIREAIDERGAKKITPRKLAADKFVASGTDKARATENAPRITVYSTSWCGPCKMAKAHLKKRGFAFKEIDVEKSPEGAEEFRKLGGKGVPLIVINGEKIRGFNAQRIDALLEQS